MSVICSRCCGAQLSMNVFTSAGHPHSALLLQCTDIISLLSPPPRYVHEMPERMPVQNQLSFARKPYPTGCV